ncbi:Uncharacterized protein BM_BM9219 [Brugia malayi]|uniref:Bm9219 n=1 Tax=Brugia malayi TaxID=6279 RepID=A0A0K0JYI3_BRUMA|nr:Uncharacterized protein BM_BM9219 [Brugia malayi]CDP93233.1 Bm9219 [Brugia malayi]VIO91967.1 Uncharacterized protein BM_BM9219 [Brugia malayi]
MLACLAYDDVCENVTNVEAKLGQTVQLKFNKFTGNIDIELKYPENGAIYQKAIIKDGKTTKYGMERFGNRITYINGSLIIRNVKESDAASYTYKLGHYSQKIKLILS